MRSRYCALTNVQPAQRVSFRLGQHWLRPEYRYEDIQNYVKDGFVVFDAYLDVKSNRKEEGDDDETGDYTEG